MHRINFSVYYSIVSTVLLEGAVPLRAQMCSGLMPRQYRPGTLLFSLTLMSMLPSSCRHVKRTHAACSRWTLVEALEVMCGEPHGREQRGDLQCGDVAAGGDLQGWARQLLVTPLLQGAAGYWAPRARIF